MAPMDRLEILSLPAGMLAHPIIEAQTIRMVMRLRINTGGYDYCCDWNTFMFTSMKLYRPHLYLAHYLQLCCIGTD